MTKVVINTDWGGFSVPPGMALRIAELKGVELDEDTDYWDISRSDPALVQAVEECEGKWETTLKVVEIPDDVEWCIDEYDGREWVAEKHRTWR